jgi:hypothetical protein
VLAEGEDWPAGFWAAMSQIRVLLARQGDTRACTLLVSWTANVKHLERRWLMKITGYIRKEVAHGGNIPRGWRLAWYEPKRRIGVYSPPGFHLILRLSREVLHRIHQAITAPPLEKAEALDMARTERDRQRLADQYSQGYFAGWRECFGACLAAVEDRTSEHERSLGTQRSIGWLPATARELAVKKEIT